MSKAAQEVVFVKRPQGQPDESTFKVQPIDNPPSDAAPNGLLLQLIALSVDPYLRGVTRRHPLNVPFTTGCVARVLKSNQSQYAVNDLVHGYMIWRTIQQHDGKGLRKIDPSIKATPTAYVGVLGMPGRTAYFGLLDHEVGRLEAGNTLVVSAAAGAVGSAVGQLARAKGAKRIVGTAGGADKCKLVKEKYGFDECLDYKEHDTIEKMTAALKAACPDGIDRYFDNTGGHVTSAIFNLVNKYARVMICGQISHYNDEEEALVPNPLIKCLYTATTVRGFLVNDFADRFDEFYAEMPQLVSDGKIKYDEHIVEGIDKVNEAFMGLFSGKNTGKVVVKM